jgi:hypothetical protein
MKSEKLKLVEKSYDSEIKGEWDGSSHKKMIFTELYLEKKYSSLLHTVPWLNLRFEEINDTRKSDYEYKIHIQDWNKGIMYQIDRKMSSNDIKSFIKLYQNTNKRYTYYPISTVDILNGEEEQGGHSLFCLYDKKYNQIELFDSVREDLRGFEKDYIYFFTKVYGKDVKITFPDYKIPTISEVYLKKCSKKMYNYTAYGFCIVWTVWYLEIILNNTNLNFKQINTKTIKELSKRNDKVCKIPVGYAHFIDNTTKNYELGWERGFLKIVSKRTKTKYIIPKVLIGLLGITGAILFVFNRILRPRKKI